MSLYLLRTCRAESVCLDGIRQLRFLDLQVSADKRDDEFILFLAILILDERADHEYALRGLPRIDIQISGKRLNRACLGCLDLLYWEHFLLEVLLLHLRDLPVRGVSAFRAEDDRILTDGGEVHVFMRDLSSHHACISGHGYAWKGAAGVDAEVCLVVCGILLLQPFVILVEGVGVEHRELAHSYESCPRSRIIPPFRLYVVDEQREALVGIDQIPRKIGNGFLVGHGKHHIAVIAVLEASHLLVD